MQCDVRRSDAYKNWMDSLAKPVRQPGKISRTAKIRAVSCKQPFNRQQQSSLKTDSGAKHSRLLWHKEKCSIALSPGNISQRRVGRFRGGDP